MAKQEKMPKSFITEDLVVKWSHLHKPDIFFGAPGDHNISVLVTKELQKEIDSWAKTTGAKKVNGFSKSTDGESVLKVKSKTYTAGEKTQTSFPCYDAGAKETEDTPFGGDVVKLRLAPRVNDRDNSLSLWLSGCQIVKSGGRTTGFVPVDGFTAESDSDTEQSDLPF